MKLINAGCFAFTCLMVLASWKYIQPIVETNGTSVIHVSQDGINKPFTVKLPQDMSKKQLELLSFAYTVAKTDGYKHPQYLQGILMQESHAGNMDNFRVAGLENKVGDRYFGIGQIKLAAAKAVMGKWPEMWKYLDTKTDEELQARLILDDKFNVRVASKYALLMGINENPTRAITAYNRGPAGVNLVDPETHEYTLSVKKYSSRLKNVPKPNTKLLSSDNATMSKMIVASSVR